MTNPEDTRSFDLSKTAKYGIMLAIGAAATAGLAVAARQMLKSEQETEEPNESR
jgi:hypothetical protein